jgi:hypothetical protein
VQVGRGGDPKYGHQVLARQIPASKFALAAVRHAGECQNRGDDVDVARQRTTGLLSREVRMMDDERNVDAFLVGEGALPVKAVGPCCLTVV